MHRSVLKIFSVYQIGFCVRRRRTDVGSADRGGRSSIPQVSEYRTAAGLQCCGEAAFYQAVAA